MEEGATGYCRSRSNSGGKLILENYGRYTSIAVDPIEKKPLYHFRPGSEILSIGGLGCNLGCAFCQNSGISHGNAPTRKITPEKLAAEAAAISENVGVAFTYNEPMIWFEFILDCAPPLHRRDLEVVLVTNGYINPEPLAELLPHVDAMNVDLKSFSDEFYREHCDGRVAPVKETIAAAVAAGVHVEVTTLLIPGLNSDPAEVAQTAEWLAGIDPDIPLHLSRYFPHHKMSLPPTPMDTLTRACEAAREKLRYVYLGNQPDPRYNNTHCPACGETVISRRGYRTEIAGWGVCGKCGGEVRMVTLPRAERRLRK